jgi:hypothetical protein
MPFMGIWELLSQQTSWMMARTKNRNIFAIQPHTVNKSEQSNAVTKGEVNKGYAVTKGEVNKGYN